MFELRLDRLHVLPLILFPASLDVDAVRVTLEESLRSLHHVDAAVGSWQVRAVLDDDGLAARRPNQADVNVPEDVAFLALGAPRRPVPPPPPPYPPRPAAHRPHSLYTS